MGHLGRAVNLVVLLALGLLWGYALDYDSAPASLLGLFWALPALIIMRGVFRSPMTDTRAGLLTWLRMSAREQLGETLVITAVACAKAGISLQVASAGMIMQILLLFSCATVLARVASTEIVRSRHSALGRYVRLLLGVFLVQVWWLLGVLLAVKWWGESALPAQMLLGGFTALVYAFWNIWSSWRRVKRLSA